MKMKKSQLYFYPLTTWKSKFWKNEKASGDIIILHMCTINDNHMMYGSWDMVRDECNFYFSFWATFWDPKIKIKKNEKKPGDIIILHVC